LKKVVIIHNRAVVGGPSVAIAETIKKLNHQFEFFLIVGKPLPDEQDAMYMFEGIENMKVIYLESMKRKPSVIGDWQAYTKLKKTIKMLSPDVVHTHGTKPGILGRWIAYSLGVKTIVHTFHGHIFTGYFNKLLSKIIIKVEQWLAKKTTHIIVLSKVLEHDLVHKFKIAPAHKVHIIPLQFNLEPFRQEMQKKRLDFRQKYNIHKDEVVVSFVGRLTAIKNASMFIDVIKEIDKRGNLQRYRFLIIGDGIEKKALQSKLKFASISYGSFDTINYNKHAVIFTSWIKDMSAAMAATDILCITSINEGTPVCVIEAMSAEVCVIATNVGSLSEMIDNEQDGFLVALNDVATMTNRVEFVAKNEAQGREIAKKATKKVAFIHENQIHWSRLMDIYEN
jgi:glycosyltransferase involved in cell wall biosynthesis